MDLLGTHLTFPLEREFEAWITEAIESSLTALGIKHSVFAASPIVESTWPADEEIRFFGKVIGLQMKRPSTEQSKPNDFGRLRWYLNKPKGQSALVRSFSEIHYCLPTFVNRRAKARALDHSLFWRPTTPPPSCVWYDNSHGRTQVGRLQREALRWGELLEQVLSCQVGYPFTEAGGLSSIVSRYAKAITDTPHNAEVSDADEAPVPPEQPEDQGTLYLVALEI